MILLLLAVSLSSITVVAWNSYKSGRAALIRAAEKGKQVAVLVDFTDRSQQPANDITDFSHFSPSL